MSQPEEPTLDASMWPDSRLRPWTIDDELDQKIVDENLKLDDRVLKTSGSKLAGKVDVAIMQFRCQVCPYVHEIREAYTNLLRTKKKEVEDVFGGDEAWDNVDRTEAVCPECSHNEAFFKQIQIRSADEPMSTFYRCTKCHAKWNDR